ncbi:hypothetical protein [Streptomyces sp. NPDC058718]|uniref:hypothetical protein n=1 Tax=Streptomyces sp. NPDC058718 TaxID=3346610 RepID=UPI00367691CC
MGAGSPVDPAALAPEQHGTRGLFGFGAAQSLRFTLVRSALDALAGPRFSGKVSDRSLIFTVKQVRRYLTEPELRLAAQAPAALEAPRPRP